MEPEIPRNKSGPGSQVDFFIWLLHGSNVSSNHNFYPMNIKYQSAVFYSKPYTPIYSDELNYYDDACRLLGGACPIIPIIDKKTGKKIAYFPPLLFAFKDPTVELPELKAVMGLYHYTITQTGVAKDIQGILYNLCNSTPYKIFDYDACIQKFGVKYITYSILFKEIDDYCKTNGINPEDAITGIFSCQSKMDEYITNYNQTDVISSYVSRRMVNTLEQAKIFNYNEFLRNITPLYASPCIIIPPAFKTDWKALGTLRHQGCALNVLSFYGIIEENTARENAVCLNIQGTSIYTIVDYINNFAITNGSENDGFMICRLPFLYGINLLYFFMLQPFLQGIQYACIFKLYKYSHQQNQKLSQIVQKLSQIGHTLSLFKDAEGNIFVVDPQAEITIQIPPQAINESNLTTYNNLHDMFISANYDFKYIDIIFTVVNNLSTFTSVGRTYFTQQNLLNDILGPIGGTSDQFIDRDPSINYGGYSKNKTQKNKIHIKKSKNQNKKLQKSNKNKKLQKSNKNKYKGGSEDFDNFEKMMTQIDEKSGIETAIVIPSSECNIP